MLGQREDDERGQDQQPSSPSRKERSATMGHLKDCDSMSRWSAPHDVAHKDGTLSHPRGRTTEVGRMLVLNPPEWFSPKNRNILLTENGEDLIPEAGIELEDQLVWRRIKSPCGCR